MKKTCSESRLKRGYFERSLSADQFDAVLYLSSDDSFDMYRIHIPLTINWLVKDGIYDIIIKTACALDGVERWPS